MENRRQHQTAFDTARRAFLWPYIQAFFACCALLVASSLLAQSDNADWPERKHRLYAPVPDLSFLNEGPAGMRGRVMRDGADLVFEDGTPVRFWGANLQANALFSTEPENIERQAKRLAALGFNLVRIHHHDSHWVHPNVFATPARNTRVLNQASLRRLDLWIEALKAQGVYIWLDLHVGRRMVPGDRIEGYREIAEDRRADVAGYNYFSPSIQNRMLEFQRNFLSHRNHLSGIRYAEDPAVVAVLITNENDVTHHYGHKLLPSKNVPIHSKRYMARAAAFAQQSGFDPERTWQSWEYGPAKVFLNDVEHRFFSKMTQDIRDVGYKGLVVPTNSWGYMPLSSLPSLSMGDMLDVHTYGQNTGLRLNPARRADLFSWIAMSHVADTPLAISEWNAAKFPERGRFVLPLRMAALAAHHKWDAPIIYGYAQQRLNGPLIPSNWDVASDPEMLASLPAAALLYRQAHVSPALHTYALRVPQERFFEQEISPKTSRALRTLYEQSAVVVEIPKVDALPWLKPRRAPNNAIIVEDPSQSFLDKNVDSIRADTGDFARNFKTGVFQITTAQTQLATGALGGKEIDLGALQLRVDQPLATVSAQSVDGVDLAQSQRILISTNARMTPTDNRSHNFRIEPMTGFMRLKAAPGLTLRGVLGRPLPFEYRNGWYEIDLAEVAAPRWMRLEK